MKKIVSIVLTLIIIYAVVLAVSSANIAYATFSGCNPNGCSYNCDCSPCKAQAGNFCPPPPKENCCPICLKPSCGDINMDDGGCPANCGSCTEKSVTCSCGNFGSITCHECTGPQNTPTPTPTPVPCQSDLGGCCGDYVGSGGTYRECCDTAYQCLDVNSPNCAHSCQPPITLTPTPPANTPTPPTDTPTPPVATPTKPPKATPTPVTQTTEVITPPKFGLPIIPTPSRAPGAAQSSPGQGWLCLKADPCLNNSTCIKNSNHRARISTTSQTLLKGGVGTYIFECLALASGYRCTTGIASLDKQLLGVEYLTKLKSEQGYVFGGMFDNNAVRLNQSSLQVKGTALGDLGPYEWESSTTNLVKRVFFAMVPLPNSTEYLGGSAGALQQGTFGWELNPGNSKCVRIQWDPQGVVFDSKTQEPLPYITVSLLKKNEKGLFDFFEGKEIMGGITNPQITTGDGIFSYSVPDGIYTLSVSSPDYVIDKNSTPLRYPSIYKGGEILVKGKQEIRNIPMRKKTIFDRIQDMLLQIGK